MDFATLDDVVNRYEGTIPEDRHPWVATLIEDASSLVRGKLPQLDSWIASGKVPAPEARRVISEIVLRRVRNPAGMQRENTETSGYVRGSTEAFARLVVLDEELAALTPAASSGGTVGTASLVMSAWQIP